MSLLTPQTYLDCVQRLSVEVGSTDDPPATAQTPSGQVQSFCHYINQAWLEVQSLHPDWKFMRVSPGVSFLTIADQLIYTPTQTGIALGVLNGWMRDTFRIYHTATGYPSEIRLDYLDYDVWRNTFQIGPMRTARVQPLVFTITPDLSIGIPCPLAGYTVTGDYHSAPLAFSADADIPSLPREFIMMIVYKAMTTYSEFESAPEVYAQGLSGYNRLLNRLEASRLPEIQSSGALA